jgi:hypothetical protein
MSKFHVPTPEEVSALSETELSKLVVLYIPPVMPHYHITDVHCDDPRTRNVLEATRFDTYADAKRMFPGDDLDHVSIMTLRYAIRIDRKGV